MGMAMLIDIGRETGRIAVLLACTAVALPGAGDADPPPVSPGLLDSIVARADFEVAQQQLLEIVGRTTDQEALVLLAQIYRLFGDYENAIQYGQRAVEVDPASSRAHFAYAQALGDRARYGSRVLALLRVGDYTEILQTAIDLDPDAIQPRVEQVGYYIYVPSIAGGDVDKGLLLARQLEQRDARWSHLMVAQALKESEQLEAAVEECRSGLETYPADQDLLVALGGLLWDLGRHDEAAATYDSALEGDKNRAYYRACFFRARVELEREGDFEQALAMFDEYLEVEPVGDHMPSAAEACHRRGTALEGLGRTLEAHRSYRKALRLDPDYEPAEEALDELDEY